MLRSPAIVRQSRGNADSVLKVVQSPIGGWNTRDSLSGMDEKDAIWLENWWPSASNVEVRGGASNHATGIGAVVWTLIPYHSGSSDKLFAVTNTDMYDVTSAGVVGASVNGNVTEGKMQFISFTTTGSTYILAVNGTDELQMYDGSTWATINGASSPAITGVNTDDLDNVHEFKRRIWFVEKDSSSAWYLPTDAVSGAATEFPVGELFGEGGYLVALGSWTVDGGSGIDDYLIFVSSEGEALVYSGTDPATDFAIVGKYKVGNPIGKKCFIKYGGEVLLLTHYGLLPLSQVFMGQDVESNVAKTDKIAPTFTASASSYGTLNGWQGVVYPAKDALIINIPTSEGSTAQQVAMNTVTNAWALFSGWNAFSWEVFNNELYYGANGSVAKAWTGDNDFDTDIVARSRTAFAYLGSVLNKHFKLVRPILRVTDNVSISLGIDVDFDDDELVTPTSALTAEGDVWDTGVWDTAIWGASEYTEKEWRSVTAYPGSAVSLRLYASLQGVSMKWDATHFRYQIADGL